MTFLSLYLYKREKWVIPTNGLSAAGYYLQVEPVDVVDITDTDRLAVVLEDLASRGNPAVPAPDWRLPSKPITALAVGIDNDRKFERSSRYFIVNVKDDQVELGELPKGNRAGFFGAPIDPEVFPKNVSWSELALRLASRVAVD